MPWPSPQTKKTKKYKAKPKGFNKSKAVFYEYSEFGRLVKNFLRTPPAVYEKLTPQNNTE